MGFYGWNQTPFIIGSHTTYRTKAILEINGFQPTRAEDHLDTVVLTAHGHRGVFVPEPIAVGDGPETFETYLAQQFAWAYSMIQVLLFHMPRYLRRYSAKHAIQFLFSETWYPLWSTSMAVLFLMPCLALLTNTPIATMVLGEFLVRYLPVWTVALGIWFWTKRWFQPKGLSLSWRGIILHIARWPIVLWAFLNVILGVKKPYMITPKGTARKELSLKTHTLYFSLIGLSFLAIAMFLANPRANKDVSGYLLFALEGMLLLILVYVANFFTTLTKIKPLPLLTLLLLCATLISTTWVSYPAVANAVSWATPQPVHFASPITVPIPSPIALGVYDPQGILNDASFVSVQHEFVPWFRQDMLLEALEKTRKLGRFPLISLEPWPLLIDNLSAETLLKDINSGKYDHVIHENARVIKSVSPQKILVRWGHEMELNGLYPWSQNNPQAYISVYRQVVDIFREEGVENVLWVWSPAGNQGAEEFWPGEKYVDFIGITILADENWDHQAGFSSLRSFETLLNEKYRLSQNYGKPLIIAELGVSVCLQRQTWLKEAKSSLSHFPQLIAIAYFNAPNTHIVEGYQPQWTISKEELLLFLDQN